jgi:hypothetical protein
MDISAMAIVLLFQASTNKPCSFEDWEAQYLGFGTLRDEWWFKAGSALMRWTRSGYASLDAAPKLRAAKP